jgi:nicotinamide N-methyltransferase
LEKDLAFFPLAKDAGFEVEQIYDEQMDKVMFEEDPGVRKEVVPVSCFALTS